MSASLRTAIVVALVAGVWTVAAPASAQEDGGQAPPEPPPERVSGKYLPEVDEPGLRPLIVLLHGYGQSMESIIEDVPVLRLAQERGWYLLAPSGLRDSRDWRYWNATRSCCGYGRRVNDDVAYLRAAISNEIVRHPIDPERVVVVGLSNGAFMAYQLACHASDMVSAIVPIAGSEQEDADECRPRRPVSVYHIHGLYDRAVFFNGGSIGLAPQLYAPYPSAPKTVRRWVERNSCPDEVVELTMATGEAGAWSNCADGTTVQYRWLPEPHSVDVDDALLASIVAFLDRQERAPGPIR